MDNKTVIAFAGNAIFREKMDGIGRYAYNALDVLARRNPSWHFFVLGFLEHREFEDRLPVHDNVEAAFVPAKRRAYELRSLLQSAPIDKWLPEKVDFYVIPELYALPSVKAGKKILVVHDLVFKDVPETSTWKNNLYLRLSAAATIRKADAVAFVSRFTQKRAEACYGEALSSKAILFAPCGVDNRFFQAVSSGDKERIREKYKLPRNFLLAVGTLEPRKNLDYLFRAFLALSEEQRAAKPLVLTGRPGWGNISVPEDARIQFAGYIEDEDLPRLYHLADALVFPSKYEGFGLPPLEAMAAEIPVIATDILPVREFAGDTIQYVPLDDIPAFARVLSGPLDSSAAAQGRVRAKELDWDNTVREIEKYIREASEHL